MFLFRDQFALKPKEINGLREICIFIVLFYIKAWFQSPSAVRAPQADLELLQALIRFSDVNSEIANAALSKVTGHLWYLTQETVALGFFDKQVSNEVKVKMCEALKSTKSTGRDLKRITIMKKSYQELLSKDLSYFVTQGSRFIFDLFHISMDFLDKDPSEWESDLDFQHGLQMLTELKVVNDVAERGVALIQEFNGLFTKDEDQLQHALLIIKKHRQQYPTPNLQNFPKN